MRIKVEGVRIGTIDRDAWLALQRADEADPRERVPVMLVVDGCYLVASGSVVEVALVNDALEIDFEPHK